jgi:hypothetical protein
MKNENIALTTESHGGNVVRRKRGLINAEAGREGGP